LSIAQCGLSDQACASQTTVLTIKSSSVIGGILNFLLLRSRQEKLSLTIGSTPDTNSFESWTKSPSFCAVDFDNSSSSMTQVTVPTPETCSVAYWMDLLVKMRKPVMLAGPAGTGKTQLVNGMLSDLDAEKYQNSSINFNFYTTSAVLANTMAIPLEKKTGSNYGQTAIQSLSISLTI